MCVGNSSKRGVTMAKYEEESSENEQDVEDGDDLCHVPEEDRTVLMERAQFSIYELYRRYKRGDIILAPDYQRKSVWNTPKKSKLVESVILNIPIPSIYFAEQKDGKWEVIDGQQRLRTFFDFLKGEFKLSALPVLVNLSNLDFESLESSHQRKIEDYSLHVFIIKENSHADIKFDIFERINEGATQLNAQELRNSMYRNGQNRYIKELSKTPSFIRLTKGKISEKRLKNLEAVLRFLSFWKKGYEGYKGNMNSFLNDTMEHFFEYYPIENEKNVTKEFQETMQLIDDVLGSEAFMKTGASRMNMSLFEVITYSFATLPKEKIKENSKEIKEMYDELMQSNDDFIQAISSSTLSKKTVQSRFSIWMNHMQKIIGGEE